MSETKTTEKAVHCSAMTDGATARTGRPKIEIDQRVFEELCKIQCTQSEICAVLGVTDKTLTSWCKRTYKKSFSEVFRQKREGGFASLRRMQFALASENAAMAIFLGKNYLGQTDKKEVNMSADASITFVDDLKE